MKSIKKQLVLIISSVSLLTTLSVGGFFIYNLISENSRQLDNYRQSLITSSERELRIQVEGAISILDKTYKEQQEGKITEAEAKARAADYVRNMHYDDGKGYFYIDTYEGVNVALLGRGDVEGKSRLNAVDPNGVYYIKEIIANGQKDGGGYTDLMFAKPGETTPLPKRNYSLAFKPYQWVVGTGMWIDYIDGKVAEQADIASANLRAGLLRIVLYIVVIQALFIMLARYIGKKFAAPIVFTTKELDDFAKGDFTGQIPEDLMKREDEFGIMVTALSTVQSNIRDLMREITASAEHVASSSEELTASAEQSSTVSGQVAESITSVAGSCNSQLMSVDRANGKVASMSTDLKDVSQKLQASSAKVNEATLAANKGGEDVHNAVAQMTMIEQAVNRSMQVISALGNQSQEIGMIVDTIGNIAGQTNLLALNAAIEAARAGEQGRGFAVVAEEVRKLAEQSQEATKQIESLIGQIQSDTQNAVNAMEDGTKQVEGGTTAVRNAGDSFATIAAMVKDVAAQSSEAEKMIARIVQGSQEVVGAVNEINTMSRSVAAESQTVSAATQEQTASMHEIADASESLAHMAQNLQEAIQKFQV
jgi:methyl-accepting chemotaxis protein